jgi:DNA-binding XRE family transcriptional regulator
MEEIDTIYIYLDSETPKILVPSSMDDRIGVFVDKKTKKTICGYEVQEASKALMRNLTKMNLNLKQILAVALYFERITLNLSQEAMAKEIQLSLSSYKSLEKAEQNLGMDTLEVINRMFPQVKKIIGQSLLAS